MYASPAALAVRVDASGYSVAVVVEQRERLVFGVAALRTAVVALDSCLGGFIWMLFSVRIRHGVVRLSFHVSSRASKG